MLQREFEAMIAQSYATPPAPGSEQWVQLQQAFFGGAIVALTHPTRRDIWPDIEQFLREALSRAAR